MKDVVSAIDTDGTLAANSNDKLATQKAIKTYVATLLGGLNPSVLGMTGTQLPWSGRTAPSWGLLEYGQAVYRTTYTNLFAILCPLVGTCTISNATPAVVTLNSHGFVTGSTIYFTTTSVLPAPLAANTIYYVIYVNANTFRLATTLANAFVPTPINTTNAGSGVHSCYACPYGLGDGSTTFNVPDKRGRVSAGADSMGGTAAGILTSAIMRGIRGNVGGEETHTLSANESGLQAHTHTPSNNSNFATHDNAAWFYFPASGTAHWVAPAANVSSTAANAAAAALNAHNNIPPTQIDNWIIVV